jgi:hypothetical protein
MSNKSTIFFLAVPAIVIVFLVIAFYQEAKNAHDEELIRNDLCERVCSDRASSVAVTRKQKIGFGSFEWRCFCDDGHYQSMP